VEAAGKKSGRGQSLENNKMQINGLGKATEVGHIERKKEDEATAGRVQADNLKLEPTGCGAGCTDGWRCAIAELAKMQARNRLQQRPLHGLRGPTAEHQVAQQAQLAQRAPHIAIAQLDTAASKVERAQVGGRAQRRWKLHDVEVFNT
jgi:hypothetical protein